MAENNMNTGIQRTADITSVSGDNTVTHDVSEEFSLPDYVPEVRKVLSARAQVVPESKYISDNANNTDVEFGGSVTYCIIYTNDDGDLCSTSLSSNYETKTMLMSHPHTVLIDTVPDSVSCRVNAPRKLTLKTRLKSRIVCFDNCRLDENITPKSAADEFYIERMSENVKTLGISSSSLKNIKMSDKFDIGDITTLRPVWCDARMIITECKAQNNSVSVRGEATVKCLCDSENGMITFEKTVPVAEEVEMDGANNGDMAKATGRCVSLSVSNEQNENASDMFFDLICEIDTVLMRNEENVLTKDAYSTRNETETSYKTLDVFSVLKNSNSSFTSSESVKRKNKDIAEIVEVFVDPVYEKTEIKGQKAVLHGTMTATVIGKTAPNEDGEFEFLSDEFSIPFKYEVDLGRSATDVLTMADFSTGNVSARYDNDKFYCTAEVFPTVSLLSKDHTTILDTATLRKDKEYKEDLSCVRVYFPHGNETLWDIAKKYHTTSKKIMEQNGLVSASIDGVTNLII